MIQRIQSVYILIAIIVTALLFKFPYAFSLGENGFPLYVQGNHILLSITIFIGLSNLICLLLYKHRRIQIRLCTLSILLSFVLGGIMLYQYYFGSDQNIRSFQISQFLPALIIVFNILAIYRVKKDEKLVRSMDRLR